MNKRILFVDPDPLLMASCALVREQAAAQWKIARAENGEHALEILAVNKFNAVVSDLRTLKANGDSLMRELRRLHPRVARISISELDDQKTSRQPRIANPFLANVTTQELFATLLRTGKFDAVLSDENLKSLAEYSHSAPSLRLISLQIIHELNAKIPSLETIAGLAQQYPLLTTKLLRTANSAAYARKTKAAQLLEAIQYLGLNVVRSIVLSAHVFRDYEHTDLRKFSATDLWQNAQRSAQITQLIMQLEQLYAADPEASDIIDLLPHIGKVMLAKSSLPHSHSDPVKTGFSGAETGRKISDASRTSEAVNLFGHWGQSTPLVEAVAFQLQPVCREARPLPFPDEHIDHPRPAGFLPDHAFGRMSPPDFDFPADINANDRMASLRTDVQKLFLHAA